MSARIRLATTAACVGAALLVFAERPAHAQEAIKDNSYALEIFQGPLLAPGRVTGVAGATTATAQSLEGVYNNAASPAVREAYSFDHFEWGPSGSISFPGAYGGTDFNNRGEKGIERQIERNKKLSLARTSTVETTDRFLYLQGGLWGQLGNFGVTATADMLRYDVAAGERRRVLVGPDRPQESLALAITRVHLVGAYAFLNNQLCVGAGVRMAYIDISEVNAASVIQMFGVAPQAGVIVKPEDRQFRLGLTARAPVSASSFRLGNLIEQKSPEFGTIRRAGTAFIVPDQITQPWEIEAGIAYQLGPRPLNPRWIDPVDHEIELARVVREKRELRAINQKWEIAAMPNGTRLDRFARAHRMAQMAREEAQLRVAEDAEIADAEERLAKERRARFLNWPREHVLLLASVLMTGAASADAVALEGFIDQRKELVGTRVSLAPRFGVESEAVPNRLKTRAGVYLEPSRFVDGKSREHFTVGLDVRVFQWDVVGLFPDHEWSISAFVDFAERYQNFGFGVGTWH